MAALMLAAEGDGPTMFARIGVMRALNRHVERVFDTSRNDHRWGRRKLARDRRQRPKRYCGGIDPHGTPRTEADHFMKCPGRGEWFDMRDLAQMLAHVHDAEIEIGEGPEPPRVGRSAFMKRGASRSNASRSVALPVVR
jgi:hypothetical protein